MTIQNATTKENTNNRKFRTIIPMLSTVLFASACVEVTPENKQKMDEVSPQILTLHELDSDSILQDVIDVYGEMDSIQVTPSLDQPNNLKNVAAIAIDFDKMSDDDMIEHKDLLLDAMAEGIPFLIENAQSGHELANLIGVGVEAELAYVQAPRPGVAGLISIYDDAEMIAEEEETVAIDIESTQDDAAPEDIYENPVEETGLMKVYQPTHLEKRDKKVNKLIEQVKPTASTFNNGLFLNLMYRHDLPSEHYTLVYVNFPSNEWKSPTQTGTGTIDQDYVIQIFNVTEYSPNFIPSKYISVQGIGGGFSITDMQLNTPGNAFHNGEMGSFHDQLSVLIDVKDNRVGRYHNAPRTGNHVNTFQSTAGFDVGASADSSGAVGTSATMSYSEQVTTTRHNFEVSSKLYGSNGYQFNWNMRAADGAMYDVEDPSTLANDWWGGLHRPAPLARSQFLSEFETIFITDPNNNDVVTFSLVAKQRVVTVKSQAHWFWQNITSSLSTSQQGGNISISLNTSLNDIVYK